MIINPRLLSVSVAPFAEFRSNSCAEPSPDGRPPCARRPRHDGFPHAFGPTPEEQKSNPTPLLMCSTCASPTRHTAKNGWTCVWCGTSRSWG